MYKQHLKILIEWLNDKPKVHWFESEIETHKLFEPRCEKTGLRGF